MHQPPPWAPPCTWPVQLMPGEEPDPRHAIATDASGPAAWVTAPGPDLAADA